MCLSAISLILVVLSASSGVDLFFVLSGFLITCLLLEEWQATNHISLKAFYARRALRLLPALVALLVAYIGYGALAHSHRAFLLDVKHALTTLFYTMNWATTYYTENIVFLRHAWSLSIEEQFYLLWPAALLFLRFKVPRNSILPCVLLGCVLSWLTRCLLFLGTTTDGNRLYVGLDTRADALLLGCSIAVLLCFGQLRRSGIVASALRYGTVLAAVGLTVLGFGFQIFTPFMYLFGWFLITLFSGIILLQLMTSPVSSMSGALENPLLRFFGRISYGLYLWHWPMLEAVRESFSKWPFWLVSAVSAVASFAICLLSYHFIEQPCLRVKKRFQRVNDTKPLPAASQPDATATGGRVHVPSPI